jgi:predicted TPR repeat methyltransferase
MPTSIAQGKPEIFNWVLQKSNDINSILDIGVGEGTYFNLLSSIKEFNWDGIEVWDPYIEQFNLKDKYDVIHNIDARQFTWNKHYDLTIAGDILEHMTKEEAIILVDNILKNTNTLIISIPVIYSPQDDVGGNPFEIHVKPDWSVDEIRETWGDKIKMEWRKGKKSFIGVFWLSNEQKI